MMLASIFNNIEINYWKENLESIQSPLLSPVACSSCQRENVSIGKTQNEMHQELEIDFPCPDEVDQLRTPDITHMYILDIEVVILKHIKHLIIDPFYST